MKTEIKVGLFVVLSLISLFILTFQVGALDKWKKKGYILYAYVDDASGISKKAKVKMRGVVIGDVEGLSLENNKVKLTLFITDGIKVPIYSVITLSQDNVLGGRYVKIIPSIYKTYYKPKDIISHYQKVASIDDVLINLNRTINDVRNLTNNINKIFNKQFINDIQYSAKNIKDSTKSLKEVLAILHTKLPNSINNLNELLSTYKKTGNIINSKVPSILNKTDKFVSKLNNNIDDVKNNINSTLNEYQKVAKNVNLELNKSVVNLNTTLSSASNFFDEGKKSFNQVNTLLESLTKSELLVDIDEGYLSKDKYFTTDITISYLPKPDKYYIFGLSSREDNLKNDKLYVNAEYGKRFDNLLLRGGIIQNQGGVGVDYYMKKDRLKSSIDLYDFNSKNDNRGKNANLRVHMSYLYLKHLRFIFGIDNILNKNARNIYIGAGIKFKDNDLKPFLSGGSSFLK